MEKLKWEDLSTKEKSLIDRKISGMTTMYGKPIKEKRDMALKLFKDSVLRLRKAGEMPVKN